MSWRPSGYARSMSGLLATLAATGSVGYYSASAISVGGGSSGSDGAAPAHSSSLAAAAAGNNGADYGFSGYCGVERHDVKDLLDGFVPGQSQDSTVTALRALPVPAGADAGRTAPERVVYRIQALAVADKIEADSDIHLALSDPADASETMIAEFPAASCLAQSTAAAQIEAARADMISALGDPPTGSSYSDLNPAPCVTLTGVAFFDRIHGQRGVAPNGIELHPVLTFQAGCGVPAPPPTTTGSQSVTTEPPDTTPVTTVSLPTVSVPTITTATGCDRYPGRHWFKHQYHQNCESYYFTSP